MNFNKKIYIELNEIVNRVLRYREDIKFDNSSRFEVLAVEEDIVLWRIINSFGSSYFYTDLEGNLLLDTIFSYASPFSKGCAIVSQGDKTPLGEKRILININRREKILLPDDITKNKISSICNNQLVIYDKKKHCLGSYLYNCSGATFVSDVPFIWNFLEFSREENWAYVGLCSHHNSTSDFELPVCKIHKEWLYNPSLYLEVSSKVNACGYIKNIYFRDMDENYSVRDQYFEEYYRSSCNTNKGEVVDAGRIDDYKKVYSKLL